MDWVRQAVRPLAIRRRQEVVDRFLSAMRLTDGDGEGTALDLGGPGWGTRLLAGLLRKPILALNIGRSELLATHWKEDFADGMEVLLLEGDGCALPLREKTVDYVFCDNVIEHVPKEQRQRLADEIERVCRTGYFITTPNFWSPMEFHSMLPLWQFLPARWRTSLTQRVGLGRAYEDVELLTAGELRMLFSRATVEGIGWLPVPETLVCWRLR